MYRVDSTTPFHGFPLVSLMNTRVKPVKGWVNSSRYFWVKYTSLLISGNSFRLGCATRTRASLTTSRENSGEVSRKKCQEVSPESSPEDSEEKSWEGQVARPAGLAGFFAAAPMVIANPIPRVAATGAP